MTPNKPTAPNPAIASRLHAGHLWRGVGEPGRSLVAAAHTGQIRQLMKKAPNGQFLLGAVALSLVVLFTACQSTPTQTAAELNRLQGYWQGEGPAGKISITIT